MQAYNTEVTNINNSITQAHQAKEHAKTGTSVGWVTNIAMIAAGAVLIQTGVGAGMGAALIGGGALSVIMMSPPGTDITQALTQNLEKMGVPPEDAAILATVIVGVVMIAASIGGEASGIGEAAKSAGEVAKSAGEAAAVN